MPAEHDPYDPPQLHPAPNIINVLRLQGVVEECSTADITTYETHWVETLHWISSSNYGKLFHRVYFLRRHVGPPLLTLLTGDAGTKKVNSEGVSRDASLLGSSLSGLN